MPKLSKSLQKAAAKADIPSGEFKPLEPGRYVAELTKVEPRTSNAGNPVWNVEFSNLVSMDGEEQPGRQWYNLNMPAEGTTDKAIGPMPDDYRPEDNDDVREKKWKNYQQLVLGRLHGFFEAFGYTTDSDTDEMIGERAIIVVGLNPITRGARAGQMGNQVNDVLPLSAVPGAEDIVAGGGGGKDESDF